ncbi:MAG TPA: twin-arginine translocase TatA/TatE family subunit [Acidimicrobiales bacterium]
MLNLDPAKLLVIAVVAIILLGPDRLPQVARQIGAAWRSFNEFRHRMESEVRSSMPDLPPTSEIARLARSPSALLNHLSTMSEDEADGKDGASADGTTADGAVAGGAAGEAVATNGTHSPAGENGSSSDGPAPLEPAPPIAPASIKPAPVAATPAPRAQPPVPTRAPETTVPVDPSLN